MPTDHTETGFENAVTAHLLAHGYIAGDPVKFDAKLALDPTTLVQFLQTSQPKEWARLVDWPAGRPFPPAPCKNHGLRPTNSRRLAVEAAKDNAQLTGVTPDASWGKDDMMSETQRDSPSHLP